MVAGNYAPHPALRATFSRKREKGSRSPAPHSLTKVPPWPSLVADQSELSAA